MGIYDAIEEAATASELAAVRLRELADALHEETSTGEMTADGLEDLMTNRICEFCPMDCEQCPLNALLEDEKNLGEDDLAAAASDDDVELCQECAGLMVDGFCTRCAGLDDEDDIR